ncbi:SpoIIE family protein phosphatase [Streptomyces sp. MI02-7b]|uniref:SpoIIE family protein phosphatase n=1 Tax=Streptomyces sp. MI02-7b TaxID=462941 RepID=UPI0029BAAEDB|nr:SpoIIE family protein phosphatase [Streptomyces sp. MI02-7b]MDX3072611.1 SpoIIE family protein phosphatase [Streptomyces sp. MI02-7b]
MPSGDVLALVDEGGRVVEWGPAAEERFGRTADEAVGRSVTALMSAVTGPGAEGPRLEGLADTSGVLVRPVLRGTSVAWQVFSAGGARPGQDAAVLKALFTHAPVALHVLDVRLCVVRASTAVRGPRPVPEDRVVGRHFTEVCAFEAPGDEAVVAQGVLDSGVPVVDRLVRGVRPSPGLRRPIRSVSYFRLEGADGEVLGLVASAVDVTERENAQNRLAFLETFRTRVGHRLSVAAVCWEVVEALVPAFTGIAVVDVIDDVVRGEEPPSIPVREDVPLRRAAFKGLVAGHPVGDVRPLPAGTPFSHVLSDLRPRLVPIDEDSSWLDTDADRGDAIRRSLAHSLIVAPLQLRGQVLGVVSFFRHGDEDPFEDDDITVASAVCAHAALCIDNARQYMREWIIASTVQHRLLPRQPVAPATLEISPLHLPDPEDAGAWFDAIPLPGARTALIVGDVTGQGITTPIMMGLLRTAVHTLAALDLQPDELLARLSDTASRLSAADAALPPMDPMHRGPVTAGCTIAIYDPVDLTCTVARAGLPELVAILPDGTPAGLSVPPGPMLTGSGRAPFPATTVSLPQGSTLAMATGALADQVLTPAGALRPLLDRAHTRPLSDLRDTIASAAADGHLSGETLMLLARTKALPPERVLILPLPADAGAAPVARAATQRQMRLWGLDEETAFTTELIVSEFVGNAVRHGAPPLRLRLILDRMLTCEVSDGAPSSPRVKHARTIDETGRGLFIVASLADRWGTRHHGRGKTVWAEQPTGRSAPAAPAAPGPGTPGPGPAGG